MTVLAETNFEPATRPGADTATSVIVPKPHVASLDGLRGLACVLVVFFHCYYQGGEVGWPTLRTGSGELKLYSLFGSGTVGVDIFFALSGFCLAMPFLKKPDGVWDWKRYAYRRTRRILPPFWIAMAVLLIAHLVIEKAAIAPFAGQLLQLDSGRQFVYGAALIGVALNPTFWTLPIEWRWYFLLPSLLILWRRAGMAAVWFVTLAICGASYWLYLPGHGAYAFLATPLPTLLPLFVVGIHAADLCSGRKLRAWETMVVRHAAVGFALGLLLFLFTPLGQGRPFHDYLTRSWSRGPFVFFAVLLAVRPGWWQRLLCHRVLTTVGLFSYSLYLIHTPVIEAAALVVRPWNLAPATHCLLMQGPVFLICVGVGYVFYLFAEKPFLERRAARTA